MIEPMEQSQQPPEGEPRQPTEEELRAYDEQISKLRIEDLILQSAVSILNLAARRIAKDDERDLAQAKAGIDAARALTDLVPEAAQPQLRQALSELQLLYAKHAGEEGGEEPAPGEGAGETPSAAPSKPAQGGEKKGDSPLWTPPGT